MKKKSCDLCGAKEKVTSYEEGKPWSADVCKKCVSQLIEPKPMSVKEAIEGDSELVSD